MSFWPYIEMIGAIFVIFIAITIVLPEVGNLTGADVSTFNTGLMVVGIALAGGLIASFLGR
jgi:predicted tellurium resistance membrane protein TerC